MTRNNLMKNGMKVDNDTQKDSYNSIWRQIGISKTAKIFNIAQSRKFKKFPFAINLKLHKIIRAYKAKIRTKISITPQKL